MRPKLVAALVAAIVIVCVVMVVVSRNISESEKTCIEASAESPTTREVPC